MPVDKFGRIIRDAKRTVVQETTASDLSVTEMNDHFIRRDGSNTVFGSINMMGNTLTNVSNPTSDHDVANKLYVDTSAVGDKVSRSGDTMSGDLDMAGNRVRGLNTSLPLASNDAVSWSRVVQLVRDSERETETKVSKSGDVISGDLLISSLGNENRIIGCDDLNPNRSFSVFLGTSTNKLYFVYLPDQPVTLQTQHGLLVKAGNNDVCQLGTAENPSEIVFHQILRMNSNPITNFPIPRLPHEAASKLYVDANSRKILQGYISPLRSQGGRNNVKTGFIASASSQLNANYKASNAFNSFYTGARAGGEWSSNEETRDFWIQIQCPDMVRVWRVALRGREPNTQRIYRWKIEGSTDGQNYTTLYEPRDAVYLGNIVQQFAIETQLKFYHFRLFCFQAEGPNPGLSYMPPTAARTSKKRSYRHTPAKMLTVVSSHIRYSCQLVCNAACELATVPLMYRARRTLKLNG